MKCSSTMLKLGIGMLAVVGTAYWLLPEFREMIVALSPTLVFLLCPLAMLIGMKMMQGQNGQSCAAPAKEEDRAASAEGKTGG